MATKRKPTTKAKAAIQSHETEEVRTGKTTLARKAKAKNQKQETVVSPEEERALLRLLAILETGFLATMVDGVVEPTEFDHLKANFAFWIGQELSPEDLREILEGFLKHLEEDGLEARLRYLAHTLDEPSRAVAFRFAAMLTACDFDVVEEEVLMLIKIAESFNISKEDARNYFREMCQLILTEE